MTRRAYLALGCALGVLEGMLLIVGLIAAGLLQNTLTSPVIAPEIDRGFVAMYGFGESAKARANLRLGRKDAALACSARALKAARWAPDRKLEALLIGQQAMLLKQAGRVEMAKELVMGRVEGERDPLLASLYHVTLGNLLVAEDAPKTTVLSELESARRRLNELPLDSLERRFSPVFLMAVGGGLLYWHDEFDSQAASQSVRGELMATCDGLGLPMCSLLRLVRSPLAGADSGMFEVLTRNKRNLVRFHTENIPKVMTSRRPADSAEFRCEWNDTPLSPARSEESVLLPAAEILTRLQYCRLRRDGGCLYHLLNDVIQESLSRDDDSAALFLWLLADLLWSAGQPEAAIEASGTAVACFEHQVLEAGNRDLMTGILGRGRAELYYDQLVEMLHRSGRFELAFSIADRSRFSSLFRRIGVRPGGSDGAVKESFSTEIADLKSRIASVGLRLQEDRQRGGRLRFALERQLRDLQKQLEGLAVRAASQSDELAGLALPRPFELSTIQHEIGSEATMVVFYETDEQSLVWILDHEGLQSLALERRETGHWRAGCLAALVARGSVRPVVLQGRECPNEVELAEQLYDELIAPIRGRLKTQKLLFVLHGRLHFIPFAALRDRSTGRRLVEDFTLGFLPSLSMLSDLRSQESSLEGRALLLGDPQATQDHSPLVGARQEVLILAALLGTRPLLGKAATEAALHRLGNESDILHLAAHGLFEPASPRFSRIALAPGDGQDGNLEVHEIYSQLDLTGVNLVVLSACDTALGERTGGDEIVGLTRAFLYAGASGVVSTLWKVDDAASTELMVSFYFHLKAGETAAEALRHAQLEMLRRPGRQDPYYWAGFVLTGDPRARWGGSEETENGGAL